MKNQMLITVLCGFFSGILCASEGPNIDYGILIEKGRQQVQKTYIEFYTQYKKNSYTDYCLKNKNSCLCQFFVSQIKSKEYNNQSINQKKLLLEKTLDDIGLEMCYTPSQEEKYNFLDQVMQEQYQ